MYLYVFLCVCICSTGFTEFHWDTIHIHIACLFKVHKSVFLVYSQSCAIVITLEFSTFPNEPLLSSLPSSWHWFVYLSLWISAASSAAAATKSLQSCPTLCDPIDSSPPGSPIPRILHARTLEWVAISFSNAWKFWVLHINGILQCIVLCD